MASPCLIALPLTASQLTSSPLLPPPPLLPPKPLLLQPREVDALYDTLEAVLSALAALNPPAPAVLLAGSALGAVRSASILFCDDDVDIGILEADAARVAAALPGALRGVASYTRRPWPGGDRVRPRAAPSAWIDVFVLRRYDSAAVLAIKCRVAGLAGDVQRPAMTARGEYAGNHQE